MGETSPYANITLLPFFSVSVASGCCWEETIALLEKKVKPNTFIDLRNNEEDIRNIDDNEYQFLRERETVIKRKLEANGFFYPYSVVDVINLYVALGLAYETEDQLGRACLDMIIRPIRKIEEVLTN